MTSTLNGRSVVNHGLLYFDEIGFNHSSGLVCSGVASDVCCYDYNPITVGGKNGSEPNGVGSWFYPDSSYVRHDCNGCVGVEMDSFQVHRTKNSTDLYQNRNAAWKLPGIYKCEIPLNITNSLEHLTQYIGIYERGQGNLAINQLICYYYIGLLTSHH